MSGNLKICPQCRSRFEPKAVKGRVQCPFCGRVVQEGSTAKSKTPRADVKELDELERSFRAESAAVPAPGDFSLPKPPSTIDDVSLSGSHKPRTFSSSFAGFWPTVAPVVIATLLFLSWVIWDKRFRPKPMPADPLINAIEAYEKEDRGKAHEWIKSAMDKSPSSPQTQRLETFFREKK